MLSKTGGILKKLKMFVYKQIDVLNAKMIQGKPVEEILKKIRTVFSIEIIENYQWSIHIAKMCVILQEYLYMCERKKTGVVSVCQNKIQNTKSNRGE